MDARYHRIRTTPVARTVEVGENWFFVDVDADGRIVGIEILGNEDSTAVLYALADHDQFTFSERGR